MPFGGSGVCTSLLLRQPVNQQEYCTPSGFREKDLALMDGQPQGTGLTHAEKEPYSVKSCTKGKTAPQEVVTRQSRDRGPCHGRHPLSTL